MNHPKSEDWALYVSKEMDPEQSRELINHLRECPACAEDLAALERTARRLTKWEFPEERGSVHYWATPLIKWGIAAALILGVGFALGKASPQPARDLTRVRAEIEAST